MKKIGSRAMGQAFSFILLMGIVSMFSDMTHEGARSIYGVYLTIAGASAATIGFVSGLGELVGYSFRLVAGFIADKKKNYWTMTLIGYAFNMLAIPAIALVPENGWKIACVLIVLERMGKAIRYPAKNTLVSFAATQYGHGKSFAVQEFLDQLGAFIGPVIVYLVIQMQKGTADFGTYALAFGVLGIPALLTLLTLLLAKARFPQPEKMDVSKEAGDRKWLRPSFVLYMVSTCFLALGFADFPLITMHIFKQGIFAADLLPILYAGAMAADAVSALAFGWMFDRWGIRVLIISTALSAFFSFFIIGLGSAAAAIFGIALWGIGMGAQESVLKSVVSAIIPKGSRATSFGLFETAFGVSWFLGSWLMGMLYDRSPHALVAFSIAAQLAAIPFFYLTYRRHRLDEAAGKAA
ncbi:MAG TPA: MFS transporter [Bacillota bacterium]|nr:MFS transporter [Bacillota bacterium]